MILKRLFGGKRHSAEPLYRAIVTAARQPHFYDEWAVPDTLDSRFDMIVLHLFLVMDRLRPEKDHAGLSQDLIDAFFADMERSLREMGVSDLSVGKKVRKMAEACYGRLAAYARAMGVEGEALQRALARNIYADGASVEPGPVKLAAWARRARQELRLQAVEDIVKGDIRWH